VSMGLLCATTAVAVWYSARARADLGNSARTDPERRSSRGPQLGPWRLLVIPSVAAVIAGVGSALIWTFGPLLLTDAGSVATEQAGWLWIALGLGGSLGVLTGALVQRLGTRGGWCFFAGALALASAGVAVSVAIGSAWTAYASMAIFGAGYMSLSGVLILWARNVWPGRAGAGTSMLFIALAIGQALGSAGFGLARGVMPPVALATLAAGFLILGGFTGLIRKRQYAA
jgi:predicted MFS family arabinose efflux permease